MKALITGGKGYIGFNLAKHLDNPIIYDRKNGDNILNITTLDKALTHADICYHLAAIPGVKECIQHPFEAFKTNVQGTFNVAYLCALHRVKLIFTSSFAVFGSTFYGTTKSLAEEIILHFEGSVCRIANVYGGDRFLELKNSAVARLMKGTWEERGDGSEQRDFIHVDDVCRQLIEYSELPFGIYSIHSGKTITIDDLINLSKENIFPENLSF